MAGDLRSFAAAANLAATLATKPFRLAELSLAIARLIDYSASVA
jgi:hypothetical protein